MRRETNSPLDLYTAASSRAARQVISSYSTSFAMATRLLGTRHRSHVRNIYALVRVADELVDGVGSAARLPPDAQRAALDALEQETESAIACGYSANPIVHAFAITARRCGIGVDETRPFFASMRSDLRGTGENVGVGEAGTAMFDLAAHAAYVHGSAEVVGLMCLRVFTRGMICAPGQWQILDHGARSLGAAFQNINFLRDLADDATRLGRSYLSPSGSMDSADQQRWLRTIRAQLDAAKRALPLLPPDARVGVTCALRLFEALAARIARTPVAVLYARRVRIGAPHKAWLVMRAIADSRTGRSA